jgi:hypothetical protein
MYRIFYIGDVSISVETSGGRVIAFTLPAENSVPEEFKEGDEVEVINHPAHPAIIGMGHNPGYYEIKHIASGKVLRTHHKDDEYKVE